MTTYNYAYEVNEITYPALTKALLTLVQCLGLSDTRCTRHVLDLYDQLTDMYQYSQSTSGKEQPFVYMKVDGEYRHSLIQQAQDAELRTHGLSGFEVVRTIQDHYIESEVADAKIREACEAIQSIKEA